MAEKNDPSGIAVYPKLPVPKSRTSEPKVKGFKDNDGFSIPKVVAALVIAAAVGGGVGFLLAPSKAADLKKAKTDLAAAQTAMKVEKDRADGAEQRAVVLEKDKTELAQKVTELSAKAGEMEKKVADANAAAEKKLSAAIDKSQGTVSTEGDEIHLKLVDKVLFAVGDDQLTDKGKAALDKVAKALAELPDKQVWVQGHTDDTPIVIPPPPKPDPKKKKGAKPEAPVAPMVRFASNWELSAARALQVVHYLQDHGKIDPTRLAALAFSEYRPVSKSNKAQNRRIEIVLYPHKAVIEKATKK
ncbi:MAG TPA: OmpA family protein [Kofleriaceae bacterium]|nr:OmpA family protein [Kofleriaceae bacterium]